MDQARTLDEKATEPLGSARFHHTTMVLPAIGQAARKCCADLVVETDSLDRASALGTVRWAEAVLEVSPIESERCGGQG